MNKRAIILCLIVGLMPVTHAQLNKATCSYNGIPLYGKVEVKKHFADIKVEVKQNFGDLKVTLKKHFANACGEWQLVEHFGDFSIEFVEHFGDISIEYVSNFPGMN